MKLEENTLSELHTKANAALNWRANFEDYNENIGVSKYDVEVQANKSEKELLDIIFKIVKESLNG